MKGGVVALASVNLRRHFVRQVERDVLGAEDPLRELVIYARECTVSLSSSAEIVVAFAMETIFEQWADELRDQPQMLLSQRAALRSCFYQPISDAIEYLNGETGDPIEIVAQLVRARSSG